VGRRTEQADDAFRVCVPHAFELQQVAPGDGAEGERADESGSERAVVPGDGCGHLPLLAGDRRADLLARIGCVSIERSMAVVPTGSARSFLLREASRSSATCSGLPASGPSVVIWATRVKRASLEPK
jgi:hypothetical protein